MGNPKAFLNIPRKEAGYRPVHDRVNDYGEVEQTLNTEDRRLQASRCMECGALELPTWKPSAGMAGPSI